MRRTNIAKAQIQIADNPKAIRKAICHRFPDIIIFVGYQQCKENYWILNMLREDTQVVVAMYAYIDTVVKRECVRHGIELIVVKPH